MYLALRYGCGPLLREMSDDSVFTNCDDAVLQGRTAL